jgi:hypothetical protein
MKIVSFSGHRTKKGDCAGDLSMGYLIRIYEKFPQNFFTKIRKKGSLSALLLHVNSE